MGVIHIQDSLCILDDGVKVRSDLKRATEDAIES